MNRGFRIGGMARQVLGAARRRNAYSQVIRPLVAHCAVLPSARTIPLIGLANIKACLPPVEVEETEEAEEPR